MTLKLPPMRLPKTIDNKCKDEGNCTISMKDTTDFKWDKLVIFKVGSSNVEVSKYLGFEYKDPTDLTGGMVFAYDSKIVYKEDIPYDPEKPNKLAYSFDKVNG